MDIPPEPSGSVKDTSSYPTPTSTSPPPAPGSPPFIPPLCRNHHLHTPEAAKTHPCCFADPGFATELKDLVFEKVLRFYTDQHRFIHLHFKVGNRRVFGTNAHSPMPLFICKLSRTEALKYYVLLDHPESWSNRERYLKPFYIYPHHDTLVFGPVQDFGTEGNGNWGFYLDPLSDRGWISWSVAPREFGDLQKLVIFHEYRQQHVSSDSPPEYGPTIPSLERGIKKHVLVHSYHDTADDCIPEILVVDSRWMPGHDLKFPPITGDLGGSGITKPYVVAIRSISPPVELGWVISILLEPRQAAPQSPRYQGITETGLGGLDFDMSCFTC
ncbi:hypothetical protein BKA65DRAFT_587189 [Rhexocercosporidium sp. MPI-PUGE-AT-0058]|nr:hypothetical protein BKA65DRAFT_587189 [Rhexocercosporidium sp. MPI-PUGE-AT-0058]